jgi:hypothetical protein
VEDRTDHNPDSPAAWLLGPADLAAIRADNALLGYLATGGEPDPTDPVGALLAAWLREVANGTTSADAAVTS